MLKQLLNHASPTSLMLFEGEGVTKTPAQIAREAIAKNTTIGDPPKPKEGAENNTGSEENSDPELDEDGNLIEEEVEEPELDADGNPIEKEPETDEEKATREAKEKETAQAAKVARQQERMQKRIDRVTAEGNAAKEEVARLKAQLEANPDKKLTQEEVNSKAEALATERLATKELERLQAEFVKNCDKLQSEAIKVDKEFIPKVQEMTTDLGPIPAKIINILSDIDNGAEVLSFMVNDIDEAEKLYDLNNRPEKLAIAIIRISDKLAEAKKPKGKVLTKVPNQGERLRTGRVNSNQITGKESTEDYIKKRQAQQAENRKLRGY